MEKSGAGGRLRSGWQPTADPSTDAERPERRGAGPVIEREDIEAAAGRVGEHLRRTPVLEMAPGAFGIEASIFLKLELLQHTGSFKPRGALNRMLSAELPEAGVITASGGNHGQAVAWAAARLGTAAEIFMPQTSPALKAERMRRFGATVRVAGEYYDDALAAMRERATETGALEVHAYDQPEVVAGQGTLARELAEQAPEIDTVLVAVGGGGLIAGSCAWYRDGVRIVSVEPRRCPTLAAALEAGEPVEVEIGGVAADSLGARRIGAIAMQLARQFVDRAVLVEDEDILEARRRLWDEARVVAEPGGAATLAALLCGAYRPRPGERVGVLVCGGNTKVDL